MRFRFKATIGVILGIIVIAIGGSAWYQHNHFNRNTTINGVRVGGLTATKALAKLTGQQQKNQLYFDDQLIYDGPDSEARFDKNDQVKFEQALASQRTILPSGKHYALEVNPDHEDQQTQLAMEKTLATILKKKNAGRKAPQDAYALLKHGKVTTVAAQPGTQIDEQQLQQALHRQRNNGVIRLTSHHRQPLSANSQTVQNEKKQLQKLLNKKVSYQVEKRKYQFTTNQVITSATYQDGQYHFDTQAVNKKIAQINKQQATLGRKFKFKTHSGQVIDTTTQGTYGWKISETKAGQSLANAIAKGTKQIDAKADIYGIGYNKRGTGYGVTTNDGLGNTYAELSIADQHAWFYRDGKCVFDADVVTGKNSRKEDQTPKGVWYIMYQASPSVLKGTDDSGAKYSSKVQFWSQFTNSGCGFHDAPWRHNWSKTAYLNDGSSGCANMHSADAAVAYKVMQVNEPVIVY